MITIQCDNCDKTFEVPDAEAGGKIPCPHCGDVNRVPQPSPAPAAAAASEGPSGRGGVATSGSSPTGEQDVCTIRPAMFRAHPLRYALIILLGLGGVTTAIWAKGWDKGAFLFTVGVLATLASVVWWVSWWLATTMWMKVRITNKRTIRQEGIIRRHTTEVLHDHVRSVDIRQNVLQRIFNVGFIGIDSAGQDGIEIQIHDIPSPHQVKEVIDRYRRM